jgi:hypothetical protein
MLLRRIAHSFPVLLLLSGGTADAQEPVATFKSGVDLVSVTAVVRDKKGKVVRSLDTKDFIVAEDGKTRKIISIQSDANAPASIAFLVDASGSMALGAARQSSRHICDWVLATMNKQKDDAALLSLIRASSRSASSPAASSMCAPASMRSGHGGQRRSTTPLPARHRSSLIAPAIAAR